MPCAGPTASEQRTMSIQSSLFGMIIDLNGMAIDADKPTLVNTETLQMCMDGLDMVRRWSSNDPAPLFDSVTAVLCARVATFGLDDFDFFMGNARNATCRRFAEWYDKHQEVDRERERKELAVTKTEAAKTATEISNAEFVSAIEYMISH